MSTPIDHLPSARMATPTPMPPSNVEVNADDMDTIEAVLKEINLSVPPSAFQGQQPQQQPQQQQQQQVQQQQVQQQQLQQQAPVYRPPLEEKQPGPPPPPPMQYQPTYHGGGPSYGHGNMGGQLPPQPGPREPLSSMGHIPSWSQDSKPPAAKTAAVVETFEAEEGSVFAGLLTTVKQELKMAFMVAAVVLLTRSGVLQRTIILPLTNTVALPHMELVAEVLVAVVAFMLLRRFL